MSDYTQVFVAAFPLVRRMRLEEDESIPGVYSAWVASGLRLPTIASAALDGFHSSVAVDKLDNFSFVVYDPRTGLLIDQDPDADGYANTQHCRDLIQVANELPTFYRAKVTAISDVSEEQFTVGMVDLVADSPAEARDRAFKCLWDAKLDTTHHARMTTVKIKHDEIFFRHPARQMVIYSANESRSRDGAGFWSIENGWALLDNATRFTPDTVLEMDPTIGTPDAQWIRAEDALSHQEPQPAPEHPHG